MGEINLIMLDSHVPTYQCSHSDVSLWYFFRHHTTHGYSSPQIQSRCSVSRSCPARGRTKGTEILGQSTPRGRNYRLHSERAPTQSGCPWSRAHWTDVLSHDLLFRAVAGQVWTPLLRAQYRFQSHLGEFDRLLLCTHLLAEWEEHKEWEVLLEIHPECSM